MDIRTNSEPRRVLNVLSLGCSSLAPLLLLFVFAGCPRKPPIRVTVDPAALELTIGEERTLTARSTSGNDVSFSWQSNNQNVATVTGAGVVAAVGGGTTKVTATGNASNVSGSATVMVAPGAVSIAPVAPRVLVGATVQLTAASSDSEDTAFSWLSSAETVATVDSQGLVTGVAAGSADITATGNSSGAKATVVVRVIATTPQLTAVSTLGRLADPRNPEDPGWLFIPQLDRETSANPLMGGHGAAGDNPEIKQRIVDSRSIIIQAAYDTDNLYLRFVWNDFSQSDTLHRWQYDAALESWTLDEEFAGDRLYLAWAITDRAGREGATFAQIGCAMMCHAASAEDPFQSALVADAVSVNDCSVCHGSPGDTAATSPPFEHPDSALVSQGCNFCHSGAYADTRRPATAVSGASMGGGMFAPNNAAIDVWYWNARESHLLGKAGDLVTADRAALSWDGFPLIQLNRRDDESAPQYFWLDGTATETPIPWSLIDAESARLAVWDEEKEVYANLDTGATVTLSDESEAPALLIEDAPAAREPSATVDAAAVHDGLTWAVVLSRPLESDDARIRIGDLNTVPDVSYSIGNIYGLSVAYTDDSFSTHHGVAGPIRLKVGP